MVFNHDLIEPKTLIHAILVADLTPQQLDTVQAKFGNGATMLTPQPQWQLFIENRREFASLSHLGMKRSYPDTRPLLIVDAHTPDDGAIWYIDSFANDYDVEQGYAKNENTLFKLRMRLEDVVMCFISINMGGMSMGECMHEAGIPFPIPENFTQKTLHPFIPEGSKDRFIAPVRITAAPDEMEELNAAYPAAYHGNRTRPHYRLKEHVAKAHTLKTPGYWREGLPAEDVELLDGTIVRFPEGSRTLIYEYDPELAVPFYWKPAGSF